jgi:nicotinamide-nucleotide amidase
MTNAESVVAALTERQLTIAVAESLTGGQLVSALIDVPGASLVVNGGVVAYNTAIKHTILGVDAELLADHGAVNAEVARQMAKGARHALAVAGKDADVGVATTGVAGPGDQDGKPVGTAYVAIAIADQVKVAGLMLHGDRASIRRQTVDAALSLILGELSIAPKG